MGEIGTNRNEYLYDLSYCDLLLIERGYEHRHRHLWSTTRWQTYYLMLAQCGSDNLRKSNINSPTDLIKFPWDTEPAAPISEEEAADLQAEIDAINANLQKEPSQ